MNKKIWSVLGPLPAHGVGPVRSRVWRAVLRAWMRLLARVAHCRATRTTLSAAHDRGRSPVVRSTAAWLRASATRPCAACSLLAAGLSVGATMAFRAEFSSI